MSTAVSPKKPHQPSPHSDCWHRILLLGAALLSAVAVPATASASKADDTLVVALNKGLTTVDRLYSTQREGLILSLLTDDGLFTVDPQTLKFVPDAAQSYRWEDSGKTLDVVLRGDVHFHDGSLLTAADVVYTYEWMLNPESDTDRGPYVRQWLKSVNAVNPREVVFHLKYPDPMALRDMAISVPLRKKGAYDHLHPGQAGRIPDGVGPYRVVKFIPGKEIDLQRFRDYFAGSPKGHPAIDKIRLLVIHDIGTQQAELLAGKVDFMYSVAPDIADNLGMVPAVRHLVGPDMGISFVTLDAAGYTGKNNPFTKLAVRRALNYAVNKPLLVTQLVKGKATPIAAACNPLQFGCVADVRRYPYDPAKARKLLATAGYPHGFSFTLWAYRDREIAEVLVNDFAKIGVTAHLDYVPLSVMAKARRARKTAALFAYYGSGGTADAAESAGVFFAAGTNRNFSGDAEVAKDLLSAEHSIDPAQRLKDFRKALQRIADQAYWIPLYADSDNYLTSRDLFFPVPRDGVPRLYAARWR